MNQQPKPTTPVYQWETTWPSIQRIVVRSLVSKTEKTATFQYESRTGYSTRRENLTSSRPLFDSWEAARAHMVGSLETRAQRLATDLTNLRDTIEESRNLIDPTK